MKTRIPLLIALVALLAFSGTALAGNRGTLARIVETGELRVGTSGDQPPFTALSKEGTLMGYEVTLAEYLAEAMGVKLKLVRKPFAELLPALQNRDVDIVMSGLTITPERNVKFVFVGPYIVSGKSILTKAKRMDALDEVDEINSSFVTVVALKNSTSQRFAEVNMPRAKLVKAADYQAAVKMVLDGKADLMVADYPICAISMLRHPKAGLAILDEPLTLEPIGVALPADAFQMYNLIENFLGALQMTGVLQKLEQEWFESGDWLIRLP